MGAQRLAEGYYCGVHVLAFRCSYTWQKEIKKEKYSMHAGLIMLIYHWSSKVSRGILLWGTCLGFQMLVYLAKGDQKGKVLNACRAYYVNLPLELKGKPRDTIVGYMSWLSDARILGKRRSKRKSTQCMQGL